MTFIAHTGPYAGQSASETYGAGRAAHQTDLFKSQLRSQKCGGVHHTACGDAYGGVTRSFTEFRLNITQTVQEYTRGTGPEICGTSGSASETKLTLSVDLRAEITLNRSDISSAEPEQKPKASCPFVGDDSTGSDKGADRPQIANLVSDLIADLRAALTRVLTEFVTQIAKHGPGEDPGYSNDPAPQSPGLTACCHKAHGACIDLIQDYAANPSDAAASQMMTSLLEILRVLERELSAGHGEAHAG